MKPGHYTLQYDREAIYTFNVWGPEIETDKSENYLGISTENGENRIEKPLKVTYSIKQYPDVYIGAPSMKIYQCDNVIRIVSLLPIGENLEAEWDGKDDGGQIVDPGEYNIVIEAWGVVGNNGKKVESAKLKVTVFKVEITTPVETQMDISNVPRMPSVPFNARIQPSTIRLSDVTFKWYLMITFRRDRQPRDDQDRIPTVGTTDIIGNSDWIPIWGGLIAGGNVHVYVTASIGGIESKNDQDGYQIRGTNPTQAQIFGIATTIESKAVCWQESTHRQFDTATPYTGIAMPLPNSGHDSGYGLMMPTPASKGQVWSWIENLTSGVRYLERVRQDAQSYLNNWYGEALKTADPSDDWAWNPASSTYADRVWDDAFARYGPRGRTIYSPYGNGGVRNCSGNLNSNPTGCNYADTIRQHINNQPWR